jgi:hypothetical protein
MIGQAMHAELGGRSRTVRKSIERGDFAVIDIDVALVDFLPEIIQFSIAFVFFDIDTP